jgi:glycosyltransferase involved in cell wall biosynthesis
MTGLGSIAAHVAVFLIYASTAAVVRLGRWLRRVSGSRPHERPCGRMRLLMSGTFYNENWFRSHIFPLTQARAFETVYVITDEPLFETEKVVYVAPSRLAAKALGRTLARAAVLMRTACRVRPDVVMGYHIMPNALLCLAAASLFGGRSVYQMTGGPTQIIGGGTRSENRLLRRLGRHSARLERLLFHVIRQFDLLIVRGESARAFVERHRLGRALVLTGSVDTARFHPVEITPEYDLVSVTRLAPAKGLDFLLRLVGRLREPRPGVRLALVGDGPLRSSLEAEARTLGIEPNVCFLGKQQDVAPFLQRSRVFVLVSPSEGMSIAMLEAMACGLPVAVTDVGDLRDVVTEHLTGVFISRNDLEGAVKALDELLENHAGRHAMGRAATAVIRERCSIEAIARVWDEYLSAPLESLEGLSSRCCCPP